MKNVLNLSNLNLVGIFGSSANRYALIRQPNGSVKKIKVGDRLNGGRVAAITESEVRYDKGGELQALTMPRG
jgi:Tfp pilus assembly protein PilP